MIWILPAIGLLILLSAAVIYCTAPGKMTTEAKQTAKEFYGLNCTHRGLHTEDQKTPENSAPAIRAARAGGYGVEIDIRLSKDDKVIVFHDEDLVRACGINEKVADKTWDELSQLKLFGTDEHIPLLTDALDILEDTPVLIELKSIGDKNTILCEKTLEIMREKGKIWCIESFDPRICKFFRKNAPDVLRGQLSAPAGLLQGMSKPAKFLLGNLFTNFIARPHFISYSYTPHPLPVKLCRAMKPMKMIWPVRPDHDIQKCENQNDTIIFEYYTPPPKFK